MSPAHSTKAICDESLLDVNIFEVDSYNSVCSYDPSIDKKILAKRASSRVEMKMLDASYQFLTISQTHGIY
jgi:hypothetical protein